MKAMHGQSALAWKIKAADLQQTTWLSGATALHGVPSITALAVGKQNRGAPGRGRK